VIFHLGRVPGHVLLPPHDHTLCSGDKNMRQYASPLAQPLDGYDKARAQ